MSMKNEIQWFRKRFMA